MPVAPEGDKDQTITLIERLEGFGTPHNQKYAKEVKDFHESLCDILCGSRHLWTVRRDLQLGLVHEQQQGSLLRENPDANRRSNFLCAAR